ncbi:hypothetical protein ETAA1_24990 [Urbifossiella limnaea]|uniref:Site-specific integrase n=2 Tax=Urbifossiella limnaea TaxID=2528023 RepID=A0A517XSQ8_9BACT|nr:hypothetical protein ETAA1_24990 [Urbifossiella limnaea]
MAHIQKIAIVRWVVSVPGGKGKKKFKRGTKETPGAVAQQTETKKYYLFDGGKRLRALYTDKKASEQALADYERAKARGEVGMVDEFSAHSQTPSQQMVDRYVVHFRTQPGNDKYKDETVRILHEVVNACAPNKLSGLTAERVQQYLAALKKKPTKSHPDPGPAAPNTKKKHHSAVSGFTRWLFENGYARENVMLRVPVPKGGTQQKDKFRSLRLKELKRLFKVALTRWVEEALTVRNGPRKGKQEKKVRPEVLDEARLRGRGRALVYRTAALTGLRRSELAKVRLRYLRKPRKLPFPIFDLPGSVTKNKKPARLWVLPRLAMRLRQWAKETGRGPDDLLFDVPGIAVFHADREAAGIPLLTERGKASFHSLRSAGNVLLRKAEVPVTTRRLFMRHSDLKLTDATYDDASLLDMKDIVPKLEKYKLA